MPPLLIIEDLESSDSIDGSTEVAFALLLEEINLTA